MQARDVVIATLKCERVKRVLADNKYSLTSNPFTALKRDSFATFVNSVDSKVRRPIRWTMVKVGTFTLFISSGGLGTNPFMGEPKSLTGKYPTEASGNDEEYAKTHRRLGANESKDGRRVGGGEREERVHERSVI